MRQVYSILLFFMICLAGYGCNFKLVPRSKVLYTEEGWFLLPCKGEMVFIKKEAEAGSNLEGFYIRKYYKGLVENFQRLQKDTCADVLLGKADYLLRDSLDGQSALYDCEKIRMFPATAYYYIPKVRDFMQDDRKGKYGPEIFLFRLRDTEYRTKLDRYKRAVVVGLAIDSKCNPRFH